ncbi:lebercilin isoform X2 [Heteronotia binoei]|uniref:lebercilin isoform X2 n=1 Tax=Heteronotia binoei TaxID=13085 RepID=UPI00292D8450|nr:lebercilin isoform X2 [Heteronotia binoei]XP_060092360.1 lebercilin isoform X2 [Heteronotia binoei]XP_060092366.1 lebercilin isoform X2 [Heteronotia binoei]XP_060092376.1 lebercilin isoform X2 [Heteronotia binoei]
MEERGRSPDSEKNQKSDSDKSYSYYSDDDDNSSCASDCSATVSTQSTNTEEKSHKAQNLKTLGHYQASKHAASKYAPSKKGMRWGFRSQSLNRESPIKDIGLVTKRVLSARLLKINELRNELTELHVKLDELQKENRALKQLQYRHEKALHKFEDTENEISQLLARHNDEIRVLRERLRKSQEKEQTAERKLKASEEDLYKAKSALQKLRRLAEHRHLPERDELAKKLASVESKLDDSEKRIKDLEKNLDLSSSSFQRQLHSEKKKLYEAQEENKVLQEEIQQLKQKLKEKERELDAKNIYARMLKPSPRKGISITPRKNAVSRDTKKEEQTTKGVQTSGYFSPVEFPPPPDFISDPVSEEKTEDVHEVHIKTEETIKNDWKEQAEQIRQEQIKEKEERLKRDQELQALEETAKKFRDEWKREESERKKTENNLLLERENKAEMEREIHILENEMQNIESVEERRQKEMLLMKMYKIDRETQINTKFASQTSTSDTTITTYSLEKSNRPFQFSETAEKIANGFPEYDQHNGVTKGETYKQQNAEATCSSDELTFGSYVPSFAKGSRRPSWLNQKGDVLEETTKGNVLLNIKRDRKTNLMEQLFGSNANTSSKTNDLDIIDQDSNTDSFPQDKSITDKVKDDGDIFFSEGKSFNPKRHRLQQTASRPAVKALNYLEDEIEEVLLQ